MYYLFYVIFEIKNLTSNYFLSDKYQCKRIPFHHAVFITNDYYFKLYVNFVFFPNLYQKETVEKVF